MKLKLFILILYSLLISGCASTGADEIKIHPNAYSSKNMEILSAVTGSSLSPMIALPTMNLTKSFLASFLIKNEHKHLDSTDALLSSLQDPNYKYLYRKQELWIYMDVVGSTHDFISNIYFLIEGKKIVKLYIKLKDVPNGDKFIKDESYIDPLIEYRG